MPEAAASGFQCLWSGLHRQAVPGQYPAQPVPPAPQPGITLILQKIMQLAGPHPWLFAIVPVVRSVLRASKWSACRLAIARGLAKSLFYGRGAVIVLPHIDYGLRRTGPEELANQRPWLLEFIDVLFGWLVVVRHGGASVCAPGYPLFQLCRRDHPGAVELLLHL